MKIRAIFDSFSDRLTPITEMQCQLLVLIVVTLANIRIYWLHILVEDDYYYGIYRWRELGSFPELSQETYWFVNRSLCWIAGNVNVYLARSLVLFCIILPCALLVYSILRKLNYSRQVAIFTAVMVWLSSGQTEIPLFVNGSYTAEAMLVMLISFWCSLTFLENDTDFRWGWFVSALFFQFLALNMSELVVPSTAAIIFCYLCWSKFTKKAWLLSAALSVLVLYHTYFNILHGGRGMIKQSHPLTYRSLGNVVLAFIDWSLPPTFISYFDDNIWHKWLVFVLLLLLSCSVLVKKFSKTSRIVSSIFRNEFIWRAVFPLLLFLFPLVIMSIAPWFHPRHAIFPAMGFYLYFSFTIRELLRKNHNVLIFIMAATIAGAVIKHDSSIEQAYAKSNKDHAQFVEFSATRQFPPKSQIVVVNMDVATCGYGYWSSGYLEYALKRKDVSGLVGKEFNLIDPFKKHEYSAGGMNGLSINDPIFLYRKNNGHFEQLNYFLQWKQSNTDADFVVYEIDAHTGKISAICNGAGLKSFLAKSRELLLKGVKRSDILWGGEFTPDDRKRMAGLEEI